MLLSSGKMSEHFSRSTCPVRQSSVTICSALWHRVMLSSVRKLMSLLLSHCTPEDPGARRFIWTAVRGLRGYCAPRSAACPRQTAAVRADASCSMSGAQRLAKATGAAVGARRVAITRLRGASGGDGGLEASVGGRGRGPALRRVQ